MTEDDAGGVSTSAEYRKHRRYVDRLTVIIQPVEHPMFGQPDTEYVVEAPSGFWDAEWVEEQVVAIAAGWPGCCGGHGAYTLKVEYSSHVWGASGAAIESVLQTVAAAVIGDAVHVLRNRLAERPRTVGEPLSEAEATERATWLVQRRYDVPADYLELPEVTIDSQGTAVTTFVAGNITYVVTLTLSDGLVTCSEITRRRRRD